MGPLQVIVMTWREITGRRPLTHRGVGQQRILSRRLPHAEADQDSPNCAMEETEVPLLINEPEPQ